MVELLLNMIKSVINGIYYIYQFILSFVDVLSSLLFDLPNEIVTLSLSLFTISIVLIIYKSIKG